MKQAETCPVKHVFMDIVEFSKNRTVEAQSYLVDALNSTVHCTLKELTILPESVILIPTGDGICISLLDLARPYDIHLQIATQLLSKISELNSKVTDQMLQFGIRIGLNENDDNLITDINGRTNVAGMGITLAQRIMNVGDAGNIIVGPAVHERLHYRDLYFNKFREHAVTVKHGATMRVFQYVSADTPGLNTEIPSSLRRIVATPTGLTKFSAYYIAIAKGIESFVLSKRSLGAYNLAACMLTYFLASDYEARSQISPVGVFHPRTWGFGSMDLAKQYEYYNGIDYWTRVEFCHHIESGDLSKFGDCFRVEGYYGPPIYVNNHGIERLKNEWPGIYREVLSS